MKTGTIIIGLWNTPYADVLADELRAMLRAVFATCAICLAPTSCRVRTTGEPRCLLHCGGDCDMYTSEHVQVDLFDRAVFKSLQSGFDHGLYVHGFVSASEIDHLIVSVVVDALNEGGRHLPSESHDYWPLTPAERHQYMAGWESSFGLLFGCLYGGERSGVLRMSYPERDSCITELPGRDGGVVVVDREAYERYSGEDREYSCYHANWRLPLNERRRARENGTYTDTEYHVVDIPSRPTHAGPESACSVCHPRRGGTS